MLVLSCKITSPITHKSCSSLSRPKSGNTSFICAHVAASEPTETSTPALKTYNSRRYCAKSVANCDRSTPASTSESTTLKARGTSRAPTAWANVAMSLVSMPPNMSCAAANVMLLLQNEISCSSAVRASLMPPRALCATSSSALPSNCAPSATHTAPSFATIASWPMRLKSKRWQRDKMVSGTFCGSVVHSTKIT